MVEIVFKILKFITAVSLQILSFSLLFWAFGLNPHFSVKHILYFIGVSVLVYVFVSYSLALFKQAFHRNIKTSQADVLDEGEIKENKNYD